MNQFQPIESKLEKVGGFFGMLFMVIMVLPLTIVAVFGEIGKAFQGVFESVGREATARAYERS